MKKNKVKSSYDREMSKVTTETADQKRFRMAKDLIQKAQDYKVQKEEEDEFFLNDGVQRDEQFDSVTRALQLDHVSFISYKSPVLIK
ncbi:MAG: hypothetical protein EOP42_02855 [Sphingobacteriaceae bacterium]|nr:MAG: hypothetical protein EOP42_02855 [Sphingobacteriaceae bacterium]